MKSISKLFVLAAAALIAACGANENEISPKSSLPEASSSTEAIEECQAIVSLEVVHLVNGAAMTDRLRLTDEAAEDPVLALRSFQVAADYFGTANVISTRPITQVECFTPTMAARRAATRAGDPPTGGGSLCVDMNGVPTCDLPTPNHTYDLPQTEVCTVTNHSEATELSCADSNAIITKRGDVVLTINTQALRDDVASRTQALRRLVGDNNVVTNFHFDVVITPDERAAIIGNAAYRDIARQIKAASDGGFPLPDIQQILHNLPEPPTNVDFYQQLMKAYQIKVDRLHALAQITSGALLSPQQVNAAFQKYVEGSRLIDQLDVEHSQSSLDAAGGMINSTISEIATTDPGSTVYKQVKAGGQSLLATHTNHGVFDPDQKLDFVVPNLHVSLTDANIEKRIAASDMLIDLNEQLRKSDGGRERAAIVAGPMGLIVDALADGDMETVWRLWDQVKATEFFFDNANPAGTSYDVHLTPEAQAMFSVTVAPNSAKAYEVINVLNETAAYDAATGKVTVDYRAVIAINARSALTTNDLNRALYHNEESYSVLSFLKAAGPAFIRGGVKELGDTVSGIYYTSVKFWSDPDAFVDHFKSAIVNWRQTLDLVEQQGADAIHRWPNMTTEEKSELLGRIAVQVLLSLPPEAKQAGRLNEAILEAVRLHMDLAARGLAIIERGGVVLSEEVAVELAKRLERYGILTTEDAVGVLDEIDDFLPCNFVGGVGFAPGGLWSGTKPPCGVVGDAAKGFGTFEARAAEQMGITVEEDVEDLLKSGKKGVFSIEDRLVKNNMSSKEYTFADDILKKEPSGVMVGNRAGNESRQAIDGFFAGEPMQLKTQTTANMDGVRGEASDTRKQAIAAGFRGVRIFQKLLNITRAQALAFINDPKNAFLNIPKVGGTIKSIDLLTSDGFWLHIENGVVR